MANQNSTASPVELGHAQTVVVVMNDKYRVKLDGEKQTGATIKAAGIAQGVPIKPDFILSIELGGGATKLVRDDEVIHVKENERFLAIDNDDNS